MYPVLDTVTAWKCKVSAGGLGQVQGKMNLIEHASDLLQEFNYQRNAGGIQSTYQAPPEKMGGAKGERSVFGLDGFLASEQDRSTEVTICSLVAEEMMMLLL